MGSDGSDPRPLTEGDFLDETPDWSLDGSSILFTRTTLVGDSYMRSIATVPAEGGEPVELLSGTDDLEEPVWSPDGQPIAYVRGVYPGGSAKRETTVWTMSADCSDARPLATIPYVESLDWSPDGTSLLVDSGGPVEGAYLLDVASGETQLVGPGADHPAWSSDGASIYYFQRGGTPVARQGRILVGHL